MPSKPFNSLQHGATKRGAKYLFRVSCALTACGRRKVKMRSEEDCKPADSLRRMPQWNDDRPSHFTLEVV